MWLSLLLAMVLSFGVGTVIGGIYVLLNYDKVTDYYLQRKFVIEEDNLFRNVFKYSPIGISMVDPSGIFLRANPTLCYILGYTENELQQMTFYDVTHPDYRTVSAEYVNKLDAGKFHTYKIKKRYIRKDKTEFDAYLTASIVHQTDDDIVIGQVIELTETDNG